MMSTVAAILSSLEVPDMPRVYALGPLAANVTFASQQCRAFNLIWALFSSNSLKQGSTIAVVGGGLGGLTTAAAAALKGCKVSLFECSDQLLPHQRGNHTRLIHPRVYEWPADGWSIPSTKFPLLNWTAGTADRVVRRIEDEWKLVANHHVTVHLDTKVEPITDYRSERPVLSTTPGYTQRSFDVVVLATGFGEERTVRGLPPRSYWENDSLHQAVYSSGSRPQRVLVTGCGDGGLVDTLRLCIKNFDHKEFVEFAFNPSEIEAVKEFLLNIEGRLVSQRMPDPEHFLMEEYSELHVPEGVVERLQKRLRPDTEIVLNGSAPNPLNPRASIMHRFLTFLLLKICADGKHKTLTYVRGRVQEPVSRTEDRWKVSIQRPDAAEPTVSEFDSVIVRHGPQPSITALLPVNVGKRLRERSFLGVDPSTFISWPDDFYPVLSPGADGIQSARPLDGRHRYPASDLHRALDKTLAGFLRTGPLERAAGVAENGLGSKES